MKRFLLALTLVACGGGETPVTECSAPSDAVEDCTNEIDDNCDGKTDCEDDACADVCQECVNSGDEICFDGIDNDCNEATDCEDSACDSTCQQLYAAPVSIHSIEGREEPTFVMTQVHSIGVAEAKFGEITTSDPLLSVSFPTAINADPTTDKTSPDATLSEGDSVWMRVTLQPTTASKSATVSIGDLEIPVEINPAGACLYMVDSVANFGDVPAGETGHTTVTIENCSETDAFQIESASVCIDDGSECTSTDLFDVSQSPGSDLLLPKDQRSFPVSYSPSSTGLSLGRVTVKSSAGEARGVLRGIGVDGECPKASVAQQTITTTPQSTVSLDGSGSDGAASYEWSLISAPYAANRIIESTAKPDFYVDLAGTYVVELRTVNADGVSHCGDRATVTIDAIPEDRIYIEMTWDSPSDFDQTDTVGTDIDLHFLHPDGNWDQPPWDVFWQNENPDWGATGDDDNPRLATKDDDGHGPEVIVLNEPESNTTYKVGVYNFDDNDLGGSFATVRVFLNGEEKFQERRTWLDSGMFWQVAEVTWPSAQIIVIDEFSEGVPNR